MIRVIKPMAPAILLGRGVAETQQLCADYESGVRQFEFKATIYAHATVKDVLRQAQHRKCAFCESFFAHIGYGAVEHFRPKGGFKQRQTDSRQVPGYYWLAYDWNNLFYSCELCNSRFKGNVFPLKDGRRRARSHKQRLENEEPLLIDPARLDPAAYITFHDEYATPNGNCQEGQTTIEVMGLNRVELVEVRRKRLANLKELVFFRSLLAEKVRTDPAPYLQAKLEKLDEAVQEHVSAAGEYAAMARAYLASVAAL
jgi:uncharacterized protein (TIGR02646 family)